MPILLRVTNGRVRGSEHRLDGFQDSVLGVKVLVQFTQDSRLYKYLESLPIILSSIQASRRVKVRI